MLFLLAKQLVMESLVAQEAEFEDKFDAFFKLACSNFANLIIFVGFDEFFQFAVIEDEEDHHFVD